MYCTWSRFFFCTVRMAMFLSDWSSTAGPFPLLAVLENGALLLVWVTYLGVWVPGPKLATASSLLRLSGGGLPKDHSGASLGYFGLCLPGEGTPLCLSFFFSGPPRKDLEVPYFGI